MREKVRSAAMEALQSVKQDVRQQGAEPSRGLAAASRAGEPNMMVRVQGIENQRYVKMLAWMEGKSRPQVVADIIERARLADERYDQMRRIQGE